jgi:hypothetical protein
MRRRQLYPWGEPPRRLFRRCNICGRWMFFRRYAFCDPCYRLGKDLVADILDGLNDEET